MFDFVKYRKFYYIFSGTLVILAIVSLIAFHLNFGIDFTGGSILRIEYKYNRPPLADVSSSLAKLNLGHISLNYFGKDGISVQTKHLSETERKQLFAEVQKDPRVDKNKISYEAVGGIIGKETKSKAETAIILSILAMIAYIAFAFRKVSRPVNSWKYGIATTVALLHDVLIPIGVMSVLGRFYGVEFTVPILTALLTIFGYSVNDTVVVFDRIRENLTKNRGHSFEEIVNKSLNQTLVRSFNTSFTTLLVLFAIFIFASQSLRYFSLTLIIGITSGTYSSIFLASPILVSWYHKQQKRHH